MFKLTRSFNCHLSILKFHRNICGDNPSSTIFALSSGQGKCGVAVIRISGSNAGPALKLVTGLKELPQPRMAILRSIKTPLTKEVIDKGLVLWFPAPRSFTGEDSFELHVHGGLAVVSGVLDVLGSIPQLRLAEPGEFTRRAFFNGKLDLTEVEGLADLLQAETEAQRKQAFLQTHGSLSNLYKRWKQVLIKSLAHIEAQIDFEETDTVEFGIVETVSKDIKNLMSDISQHLRDGRKGETLRNGAKTVIIGEPNVGKSSLLNMLCRRPAAIVTPIAGTTRDILEVTLNMGGYPLVLADTAGLRSGSKDIVEIEGINRAVQSYNNADLIILVLDCGKYISWKNRYPKKEFRDYLKEYVNSLNLCDLLTNSNEFNKNCVVVLNKTDLDGSDALSSLGNQVVKISCKTETGASELVDVIVKNLKNLCGEPSAEHPSMNQVRHRQHLTDCLNSLQTFSEQLNANQSSDLVLVAENLRKSLRHLGKLVGAVTNEQLLDVIFKDFCIGK